MINNNFRNLYEENLNMAIDFIIVILLFDCGYLETNNSPETVSFPPDIDIFDVSA